MDMLPLIYKSNIYQVLLYASTMLGIRNTKINSSKSLSSRGTYQQRKTETETNR